MTDFFMDLMDEDNMMFYYQPDCAVYLGKSSDITQ